MNARRPLLVVIFLTIFAAVVFVARYGLHDGTRVKQAQKWDWIPAPKDKNAAPGPCTESLAWLAHYQFTSAINYVSRDIITIPAPTSERPFVTQVDLPLFDEYTPINLSETQTIEIKKCLPPLELQVPHGRLETPDASNIIFGLQTTLTRLRETTKHLARWLPNTGARLFCIVIEDEDTPAKKSDMAKLEKEFHELGMNVTLVRPVRKNDAFPQRYFSLVNIMYAARDAKTQWISTIDDDTFFPSMHDLLAMLSTHNSSKQQYIGSLSEDWWAVDHYGLMGFGGASIFLSVPMAKILDDNKNACNDRPRTTAGDVTIMDCVYRFSPTKLTHINALHQFDFYGDQSGFYESGREVLSVHHWKGAQKLEMDKMHLVADVCDNCFLQRWQFPNDILLSNGFSITQYPLGHLRGKNGGLLRTGVGAKHGIGAGEKIKKIDLREMEATWQDELNVLHSLGPIRPKMTSGSKISFKLLDSMIVDSAGADSKKGNAVRQVYFKEGGEGENDTVMVLNWRAGKAEMAKTQMEIKAVETS